MSVDSNIRSDQLGLWPNTTDYDSNLTMVESRSSPMELTCPVTPVPDDTPAVSPEQVGTAQQAEYVPVPAATPNITIPTTPAASELAPMPTPDPAPTPSPQLMPSQHYLVAHSADTNESLVLPDIGVGNTVTIKALPAQKREFNIHFPAGHRAEVYVQRAQDIRPILSTMLNGRYLIRSRNASVTFARMNLNGQATWVIINMFDGDALYKPEALPVADNSTRLSFMSKWC